MSDAAEKQVLAVMLERSQVRVYSDKDREVPWRRPARSLAEASTSTLPKLNANLEPQDDSIVCRPGSSGSVVGRRPAEHSNVLMTEPRLSVHTEVNI